ncbi:MAG: topoisomerase C-terminal repeat-containing protein, partial [Sphaerochaetaceae bacterium]
STKRQPVELDDGIQLMDGKFGLYWQKGEKKASVPSWANDEQARDSQFAERYLSLPRVLGMNEKGEEVYATVGKYGPYVGCNGTYRNLNKTDKDVQLFAITLEEALSLLSQEKTPSRASFRMKRTAQAGSLRTKTVEAIFTYGQFEGRNVDLANGKYGFYVRHDGMNYSLPYACKKDEAKAKGLSLDNVIEIIKDKRQKDTT